MSEPERKLGLKETFDTVAEGYDALRFFPASAKYLADALQLSGHEHVLDVATGTGNTALEIARRLPQGHVTGVDFSEGMLAQARTKAAAVGLANVRFTKMDMQAMSVPNDAFDVATCAFGIFFVEDMARQLAHIAEKVKPAGRIALLGFQDGTFSPAVELLICRLDRYGIERPSLAWKRIGTADKVRALLESGGLRNVRVERADVSYPAATPGEWWQIVWNAAFRTQVSQLSPEDLRVFKEDHLNEVRQLTSDGRMRLNIEVLCAIAEKA